MHLHQLPPGRPAYIDSVEWDHLSPGEAQRLREFGVEEGATVEILHRAGLLGRGALACRIGRMTIAMRHAHADAIQVRTGPEADTGAGARTAAKTGTAGTASPGKIVTAS
ncbi:MAG: ferrous iron transport protein A [Sphingobium sp.]